MHFDTRTDKDGYTLVRHPATGLNQRVHWIMARCGLLGKIPSFAGQRTIIHHRNFRPGDNRLENLEFMGDRDHMSYHKSIAERNRHFQSAEFEARRKAAISAKAQTADGHAYFAARGSANLARWREQNPGVERQTAIDNHNGERGKQYLVDYNKSGAGRAKSSEVAHRTHACETCG